MPRRIIALTLSTLLGLAVACGGSGDDSTEPDAAPSDVDTTEAPAPEAETPSEETQDGCPDPQTLLRVFGYMVAPEPSTEDQPPGGYICSYNSVSSDDMVFINLMVAPLNEAEMAAAWQDAYDEFEPCLDGCPEAYADGTSAFEQFDAEDDLMVAWRTSESDTDGIGVAVYARNGGTLCYGMVVTSSFGDVDTDAQREKTIDYVRGLCA